MAVGITVGDGDDDQLLTAGARRRSLKRYVGGCGRVGCTENRYPVPMTTPRSHGKGHFPVDERQNRERRAAVTDLCGPTGDRHLTVIKAFYLVDRAFHVGRAPKAGCFNRGQQGLRA